MQPPGSRGGRRLWTDAPQFALEDEMTSVIYNPAYLEYLRSAQVACGPQSPFVVSMQRIPSLDGLRTISITLVILSHLVKWKHISLDVLGGYGALGVHVFFVLSGYLITNLLLREYERTSTINLREFLHSTGVPHFPRRLRVSGRGHCSLPA